MRSYLKEKVLHSESAKLSCFKTAFPPDAEDELVDYIKNRQLRFFGMARDCACSVSYDFARKNNFKVPFNPRRKKQAKIGQKSFLRVTQNFHSGNLKLQVCPEPWISINLKWINSLIC